MTLQVYQQALSVMKTRGGPYSGMDIPEFYAMLEYLFTPEEAEVNNALERKPASAKQIAAKMNRGEHEIGQLLETIADKGLCATFVTDGVRLYQGLPFMPGIMEYQFFSGGKTERHKKIATLIHEYKKACEAARGVEKISFPLTRVIPVNKRIPAANVIHTYDQVAAYIEKYDTICVGACYCRHEAQLRGEDVHGMPMEVCMWFGNLAEYMVERLGGRKVTKQEAGEILDQTEKAGLVHMSRNTTEDISFVCNCDRWHCEVIQQVLKQPVPGRVFNSGYQPVFDGELCVACETCIERCPPDALKMVENNIPSVNLDRCFGCAVCASGCPEEAVTMSPKPNFPTPPKDVKELVMQVKHHGMEK